MGNLSLLCYLNPFLTLKESDDESWQSKVDSAYGFDDTNRASCFLYDSHSHSSLNGLTMGCSYCWFRSETSEEAREREKSCIITFVRRQTDRSNVVGYRHAIVEPQQRHVVIEVAVAELLGDCTQYESRLWSHAVVASIVLAKRHLNHEPHESFDAMRGYRERER